MAAANLIEKFLANKETAKVKLKAPAPKRDSLPNPEDVPTDQPVGTNPVGQSETKGQRKKE